MDQIFRYDNLFDEGNEVTRDQFDPADNEPFNASGMVPGVESGDYPQRQQQAMIGWFPSDLVQQYRAESIDNGAYLEIPERDAGAVIPRLEAEGHSAARSDLVFF